MMTQAKISKLISQLEQEKNSLCVSVLVPTLKLSKGRTQNPERIRKALNKAKTIAKGMSRTKAVAADLNDKLDALLSDFDNVHSQFGIGFFASANVSLRVHFPFEVQEKIVVGNSFELRDLYYYRQFATEYYILLLTNDRVQLFKACMDEFEEVVDNNFPAVYEEEYEYASPAPASSMRNALQTFERDKKQLREIRQKSFYQETDTRLGLYLTDNIPLVLAGVKEQLSMFKSCTRHSTQIESEIIGNFSKDQHRMAAEAWKALKSHQLNFFQTKHIKGLKEAVGKKRVVSGIRDVWDTVREGRGSTLFVERDFEKKGYLSSDKNKLFLKPPKMKYEVVVDIVDDIMEEARRKNTAIYFTDNDKLKYFDRIALELRY